MATQAQTKANRQNAQKSTGPKTDEGKAAVSLNAVKHGLFTDSLVFGENLADYEVFHDQMLAELDPVGVVETAMAERIINLWWRLKRAERMQNEVIEDMIVRKVTNSTSRTCREYQLADHGLKPDDPGYDLDGLALGRIATKDFACCRILDKMLMYERRIESSLHKILRELERRQRIRQSRRHEAKQEQSGSEQVIPSTTLKAGPKAGGFEAATHGDVNKCDLKKQSQFIPNLMGVTPFIKGIYDKIPLSGDYENKADQSQLIPEIEHRLKTPGTPEGVLKMKH